MEEEFPRLSAGGISDEADLVFGADNHIHSGRTDIRFGFYETGSFFPTRRSTLVPVSPDCTAGQKQ